MHGGSQLHSPAGWLPATGRTRSRARPKLPAVHEPLARLAAYFRGNSRLPAQDLVRLTAAARAAGSRWDGIAAGCGLAASKDLRGTLYWHGGQTGAEMLYCATQNAVRDLTGTQRYYPPLTWSCPQCRRQITDRGPAGLPTSSTATPPAVPAWPGTRRPRTSGAASTSPA
jgi:hypothetical protein